MYAVIETGGKQYLMQEGKSFKVEKLEGNPGESIVFDKVLLLSDFNNEGAFALGNPYLSNAKVKAQILETAKGKKLLGMKFRHKTGYRRKYGHRQFYTKIMVEKIESLAMPENRKGEDLAKEAIN